MIRQLPCQQRGLNSDDNNCLLCEMGIHNCCMLAEAYKDLIYGHMALRLNQPKLEFFMQQTGEPSQPRA